jgi:hypothetical protein
MTKKKADDFDVFATTEGELEVELTPDPLPDEPEEAEVLPAKLPEGMEPATIDDDDDFFGNEAARDSFRPQIPRMKITYTDTLEGPPMDARNNEKEGEFFNSITKQIMGTRRVVLCVMPWVTRSYFTRYSGEKDKLICASQDGKMPVDKDCKFVSAPLAGPCATCPKNQWKREPGQKDVPPECTEMMNLLLWDLATSTPIVHSAKKKGRKYANSMLNGLMNCKRGIVADGLVPKGIRSQLFFPVVMSIRKEPYGNGFYYVADYTVQSDKDQLLPLEEVQRISAFVDEAINASRSMVPDEISDTLSGDE